MHIHIIIFNFTGRASRIHEISINSCKDKCHESVITPDWSTEQFQDRRLTLDSTSRPAKDKS